MKGKTKMEWSWTGDDVIASMNEGWSIFETPQGPQIQSLDETDHFEGDHQAWLHVKKKSGLGNDLHVRAMRLIERYNPDEFRLIMGV